MPNQEKPIDILLAEDSETDAELTIDALQQGKIRNNIYHVWDGEEVLRFLRKEGEYKDAVRPDLILLDLNMPRMDGRTVLKEIRSDDLIKAIPVVVLTTSSGCSRSGSKRFHWISNGLVCRLIGYRW
ncbi:MAG: response regulator [bacterium]|nr:response regulator [bacterium]